LQPEPGKTIVEKEAIHPYRWAAVYAAFLIIGIGGFLVAKDLRHKDSQIQSSRVESCIRNYGAFNQVFARFFPPPAKRTKRQQRDLNKLHSTVRQLQSRCAEQIKLDKEG
jgi:hypothetical protein